jgi:hypothetical protein
MSYPKLKGKPKTFQGLTGLNPQEFEKLLVSFGAAWSAYVAETFHREDRQQKQDKKITDEEGYEFSQESILWQDIGFQGYAPEGVKIEQPKKKPREVELSIPQKEESQKISKMRVEVEHHIGGIKRSQIVVQKFRNRMDHYGDDVMENAFGLHNFRLTHRQMGKQPVKAA